MNKIFAALLVGLPLLLGSCAEDNTSPAQDVADHFQRGLSGEGSIGPIDRANDPYVRPRVSEPPRP